MPLCTDQQQVILTYFETLFVLFVQEYWSARLAFIRRFSQKSASNSSSDLSFNVDYSLAIFSSL